MEPVYATPDDVLNYVSGEILGGPDDDIWDNIFDWLMTTMATVIHDVAWAIADAIVIVGGAIAQVVSQIVTALHPLFTDITAAVNAVGWNVLSIITTAGTQTVNIINATGTQATRVINEVGKTINSIITTIGTEASRIIREVTASINSIITTIGTTIATTTDSILKSIASFYASVAATTTKAFTDISATITTFFTSISKQIQANMDWLTLTFLPSVSKLMDTWWDDLLAKIFDFPSWVGKLFDAISTWVTRDVPGSSPWWEGVIGSIWTFLVKVFWEAPGKIINFIVDTGLKMITTAGNLIAPFFVRIFEEFNNEIAKYSVAIGSTDTSAAQTVAGNLVGVASAVISGLLLMTAAGELTIAGSKLGLGNVSAMIYDMTNYKLITGGIVGALVYAAIKVPLGYYYNNLFRPKLPQERQADELYSRDLIPYSKYSELLGYQGLHDVWHEKYADMAYRPASLYTLSTLATTGVYDEKLFRDNLRDWGLRPDMRELFIAMYKAKATETVKGTFGSIALTRFKEGFSTESGFISELRLFHYTDEEIPSYVAAGNISYATDYLTDMKAAYTDAVRADNLSLEEYRDRLLSLGIVPERAESFFLRERVRKKPKEDPKPLAPPEPLYMTDQGKIQVDTLRRQRRKNTITRDQEIAELLMLGMDVGYATAVANNDDIRLATKAPEEAS